MPARIDAYVEGFDDIGFWTAAFAEFDLNVFVQAICDKEKANGKDTIIKALTEKRIMMGPKTLIGVDSDYDYLLDKDYLIDSELEHTLYKSDYCFQTYSYAIENYSTDQRRVTITMVIKGRRRGYAPVLARTMVDIQQTFATQNCYPK